MKRDLKSGGMSRPNVKKLSEAPALKLRPSAPLESNIMFPPAAKKVTAKKAVKKTVAKKATKKKAEKEASNA